MKNKLLTVDECDNLSTDELKEIYRRHISPSLVEVLDSFSFADETIESAEGVWLKTKEGKNILDVSGGGGVLNLGHNPPSVLASRIRFQQEKKPEVCKLFLNRYTAALAHNISCLMPGDLNYTHYCNSGAEAVEGALKLAYKFHDSKRDMVLHSDIAFHGKLLASGSLRSKAKKEFSFQEVLNHDSFVYGDINSLREKVSGFNGRIYAIIVEPFNASHIRWLSPEFLRELRKLCDENGIILIFDEIYTGWYKTGPMMSFMNSGIIPDVVTISKSLGAGKATISAFVATDKLTRKAFGKTKDAFLHSTTYFGYPEECLTAIEALALFQDPAINERAGVIEKISQERINILIKSFPDVIAGFRGRGALHGIIFRNQGSLLEKVLSSLPGDLPIGEHFLEKLIIASVTERLFTKHSIHCIFTTFGLACLQFAPPLIIKDQEIHAFFDALEDVLAEGIPNLVLDFTKKKIMKKFSY